MISTILTAVTVSVIMMLLFKASKKNAKNDGHGNIILQLPKFYWILGAFALIIGLFLLVIAIFYVGNDDRNIVLAMSLGAILLGALLFAKGYISNIKISEESIVETSLLGKEKEIKWTEIESVSFGKVSLELKIKSNKKAIKAHVHLIGFPQLIEVVEAKTGITRQQMGFE